MKARAGIAISVVVAFFAALTLASAPQLHEKLHKVGAQHECAATMIASGNYEHGAPPAITAEAQESPISPAFLPPRFQFVIAAVPCFILEHAPPVAH